MDVFKAKIVGERLCMSIAYIALKACNTFWTDSVQNIINFGSVDQKQCYISIMILKNIATLFD